MAWSIDYGPPLPVTLTPGTASLSGAGQGAIVANTAPRQITVGSAVTEALQGYAPLISIGAPPSGLIKFAPGHFGLAGNALYTTPVTSTNGKDALFDINEMISNGAITSGLQGYCWGAHWTTFDKSTNFATPSYDFSVFWQIFNVLQALWPGAKAKLRYTGNKYTGTAYTATQIASTANLGAPGFAAPTALTSCGGSITVPNGFGSGSSATYPVAACSSGSPNYGINFQDPNGTVLETSAPHWYNPGVMQAFINSMQAFAASTCPTPTTWGSGVTYSAGMQVINGGNYFTYINETASSGNATSNTTFWASSTNVYVGLTPDQIPVFTGFGYNDEISNAYITAQNISGVTVNPPPAITGGSPSITVSPTNTAFWIQFNRLMAATVAAMPHTIINSLPTYGWGAGSSVDTPTNMAANVNANCPSGNRTAPYSLSTIVGLALSGADTYGFDFVSGNNKANNGKQGFVGVVVPVSPSLGTPTVGSQVGLKQVVSQVQGGDYFHNVSGAGNNASAVQQILTAGLVVGSQEYEWCLIAFTGTVFTFPTYLFSTLVANPLPTSSFLRTPDIMTPVTINAVNVLTTTSLSINFTPFTLDGAEQGLSYRIYRDGVSAGTSTNGVFNDTGLTTGVAHVYTIGMTNSNGNGPVGSGVSGTPH